VAPSRSDSIELVEYNPTSNRTFANAWPARTESRSARHFTPSANSQSLAGLHIDVEKAAQEKLSPNRPRVTRLRFWAEALRHRALNSSQGDVDSEAAKMKFSHSVQFNAVPDWSSNYIAYSNLKKL